MTKVTGSSTAATYDCSVPHTLAFQIGGKLFPVDARDFFNPTTSEGAACRPNVVATDPPKSGFLYSWSLGDPFLKSVVSSFYFGNLTHPSADPPRMGFLSTVPADASQNLKAAVAQVQASSAGVYPTQIISSPPSSPSAPHVVNAVSPNAVDSTASPVTQTATGSPVQGTSGSGGAQNKTNGAMSVELKVWLWGAWIGFMLML